MRGERQFALTKAAILENFRHMAVINDGVSAEIPIDLAETGLERRFAACTADPGFRVANDSPATVEHLSVDQRAKSQVRGRGIAARICHEPRFGYAVAIELGQSINGLTQKRGRRVALFVPLRVRFGIAQAKGAAQIDYLATGIDQRRGELDGHMRRGSKKNELQTLLPDGGWCGGDGLGRLLAEGGGRSVRIRLAVLEQNRLHRGMARQDANQFRSAVASEAEHPHGGAW